MSRQLTRDLLAIQKFFSDPNKWAKHGDAFAIVLRGQPKDIVKNSMMIDALDPRAACWCLTGGLQKIFGWKADSSGDRYDACVKALAQEVKSVKALHLAIKVARDCEREVYDEDIVQCFNDTTTYPQLMAWIDRTITVSEKPRATR